MEAINVVYEKDRMIIQVDTTLIDKDFVLKLVEKFQLEYLAKKVNFSDDIEELGREIKSEWWKKNKNRLLGLSTNEE